MPVDYSKWDALELSDDSDIEVHPNVDKKSFIRAKQSQIHQEREQRRLQIEAYKYESIIHEGLLARIDSMVASLQEHASQVTGLDQTASADAALRAMVKTNPGPTADMVPPRPEGLAGGDAPPTYTVMLAALIQEIGQTLDEKKPSDRYQAFIDEFKGHAQKIRELESKNKVELDRLQSEQGKKITSADIHTGFDISHVAKKKAAEAKDATTTTELLNPGPSASGKSPSLGKNSDISLSRHLQDYEEDFEASPMAQKFAEIAATDYPASLQFIMKNRQVLTERESDGILGMAFNAALEQKDDDCQRYVHQALLLQYCRILGQDGMGKFFNRISLPGQEAQEVFYKDVRDTVRRVKKRAGEIIEDRAKGEDREQIQLHAVEPGSVIQIRVPAADSEDPAEQQAREIFEGFEPAMQSALQTGDLEQVNKVLGSMRVDEAEQIVALFGEANILSLGERIIDATTEAGQQELKDLEAEAQAEAEAEVPVGFPE